MHGNLKEQHEEAVASNLLKTLGIEAEFLRHGNDATEPDVLFKQQGKILGIEVATAYYDDLQQAKSEWQIARGIIKLLPKTPFVIWRGSDFDETICKRIQQEIHDKCSRKYVGADFFWLCIEHRGFLSDYESVVNCLNGLHVPSNRLFDKIYILYQATTNDGGGFRAFELPTIRQVG